LIGRDIWSTSTRGVTRDKMMPVHDAAGACDDTGSSPAETTSCVYDVDPEYRIGSVDEGWSAFARANAAPELLPPAIIGQSMMSHIVDATTTQLYKRLFDRVLATQRTVAVPLRCDGPTVRRFLELQITPRGTSGFRLRSLLVRSEPRAAVPLLARDQPRGDEMIRMCSWCGDVVLDGAWSAVEDAVRRLGLFECERLPVITHGICPRCESSVGALLE
jgi:hypothetical protein